MQKLTNGKLAKRFPFWRERGTSRRLVESRILHVRMQESVLMFRQSAWRKVNTALSEHGKVCRTLLLSGMKRNLLTKIKCFLSLGEIIVHPNLGALNKPSLTMVKKNYSSSTFAFIGILPLPGHSRFVKIYLTLQSLPAFYFSLQLLS